MVRYVDERVVGLHVRGLVAADQLTWCYVVRPLGFEPRTCGLRVRCSAIELEARRSEHTAHNTTAKNFLKTCVVGRSLRASRPTTVG